VDWFSQNSLCPTGCGCHCQSTFPMPHAQAEPGNQEMATVI
jgi:hypothetical protein